MTVGENIRRIRQERNITQKHLGELVGASEAYIRAYESGRRNPNPASLETISKALAVNVEGLTNFNFFKCSNNMTDTLAMMLSVSASVHLL